eukprot:366260-Chlamydomonas_euryale.AAC.45
MCILARLDVEDGAMRPQPSDRLLCVGTLRGVAGCGGRMSPPATGVMQGSAAAVSRCGVAASRLLSAC